MAHGYLVDDDYSPAIQAAARLAKQTLNKYYSKTDETDVYRIAMGMYSRILANVFNNCCPIVLHPRHKMQYFKAAGWEEDWSRNAETLVRQVCEDSYATRSVDGSDTEDDGEAGTGDKVRRDGL